MTESEVPPVGLCDNTRKGTNWLQHVPGLSTALCASQILLLEVLGREHQGEKKRCANTACPATCAAKPSISSWPRGLHSSHGDSEGIVHVSCCCEWTALPLRGKGVILDNMSVYCYTFILNNFKRTMSVR